MKKTVAIVLTSIFLFSMVLTNSALAGEKNGSRDLVIGAQSQINIDRNLSYDNSDYRYN